ncbi:MAG: hypothetical protein GWP04_01480 [Gammaproteobacteria bacterium]|nr:hypothetical protein [Gammaproteobacteria bacterium]
MNDRPVVAISVPLFGDERRKNWAKVVERVDEAKSSGWAFEGEFIATGGVQDVPVGSVILVYGERGSRAHPQVEVGVFTVNADGTLSRHAGAKGRAWARTLRDDVIGLLEEAEGKPITLLQWSPDLIRYEDDALLSELRRRGRDV